MSINRIEHDDVNAFRIMQMNENALDVYQHIATKSAIYPGQGTPLGLAYVALKGAGEAGEFAEHVGKAMRDDGFIPVELEFDGREQEWTDNEIARLSGRLTPERKAHLIKEIGDQLWYLSAKCNELGVCLSYAALMNLEKLLDRTERETLQGSGDDR